jgi:hypothetical protein
VISFGAPKAGTKRGFLAVLVLTVVVLSLAAAPAVAKPGGKARGGTGSSTTQTASITFAPDTYWNLSSIGCAYEATYRWSGFSGSDLTASIRLVDPATGSEILSGPHFTGIPTSGELTNFFVFSTAGNATRSFAVVGSLQSAGVEIASSRATASPISTSCGGTVTVQWYSQFNL